VGRRLAVLAGGTAAADATTFTPRADLCGTNPTIGENQYLAKNASTISYEVTITTEADGWSHDETAMLKMTGFPEPFAHTDHNPRDRHSWVRFRGSGTGFHHAQGTADAEPDTDARP